MSYPVLAFCSLYPGNGGGGLPVHLKSTFGKPDCPHRVLSAKDEDDAPVHTVAASCADYAVAGGPPACVDRWLATNRNG